MMSSSRPSTNEDAFNLTFVPFVATPMDVILLSDIESRTAPLGGIQVSVYGSFEFGFSENLIYLGCLDQEIYPAPTHYNQTLAFFPWCTERAWCTLYRNGGWQLAVDHRDEFTQRPGDASWQQPSPGRNWLLCFHLPKHSSPGSFSEPTMDGMNKSSLPSARATW